MKNDKILVTGATGFLGKRLAFVLQEQGYEVTAIGRNQNIGNIFRNTNIKFVNFDLTLPNSSQLCKGQNIVIHCAAFSSPWGRYKDFFDANVLATRYLVDGCLKHNVKRLIHVSTPSIYFNYTDRLNIKEDDPLPEKMVNYYADTKLLAEKEVEIGFAQGLATIIIRPRGIFGPGDTTIFPRLIKANNKLGIPLIDNGANIIDVTYVDNLVDVLISAIDSPSNSLGRKYNISNGEPITMKKLLTTIFQELDLPCNFRHISFAKIYNIANILEYISKILLFNQEPLLTKYGVGILAKSITLNIDLAKKYLNYSPQISIEEGIKKFANWYKKQHAN